MIQHKAIFTPFLLNVKIPVNLSTTKDFTMTTDNTTNIAPLFTTSQIGTKTIPNRLAVAPMTRVSALEDGTVGPLMREYYADYAKGGFGLVITEGLYTDTLYSQCYLMQPGLVTQAHADSWMPVIQSVHDNGAVLIAQLMHGGALAQYVHSTGKNMAPSAVKPRGEQMGFYYGSGDYLVPEAMSQSDIDDVVKTFAASALLAKSAGFDGIEIHSANGYLLDQFVTVHTNQRDDHYGGSLENRLRIHKEIITAIRNAVGDDFIVGIRFSQGKVNDAEYKWVGGEADVKETFTIMGDQPIDYIHSSEPVITAPAFSGSTSLASMAKQHSGLPVIANGGVHEPQLAQDALAHGHADFIALGKTALANPNWPLVVKKNQSLKTFDFSLLMPIANLENAQRYFAQSQ